MFWELPGSHETVGSRLADACDEMLLIWPDNVTSWRGWRGKTKTWPPTSFAGCDLLPICIRHNCSFLNRCDKRKEEHGVINSRLTDGRELIFVAGVFF